MSVATKSVSIEVPEQIVRFVVVKDDEAQKKRDAMLLYPYIKDEVVSFGRAAEMLGMNKLDLITLYGKMGIDYVDMTDEEFDDELKAAERVRAKLG
ncbi:MAG: UPF0175 family protein [Lachnospiraceae bacterium]|nr:UPF0175 family protein [Lachnospiraceae bacterium]